MKKLIWGVLVLLAVAVLLWAFIPAPQVVEVELVSQGRFERAVQEDGKTRVRDRYLISAPIMGRIDRSTWRLGDAVTPQDTLATLWPAHPTLLDARVRAEQVAHVAAMQADVDKAMAHIERAGVALAQAHAQSQRSEALAQSGFVSTNQSEMDQLNLRLREKELSSTQHEAAAAQYALAQSRVALRQFSKPSDTGANPGFAIKSPVHASVLKIFQPSEGLVAAGTPLMELGNPAQLEVVVDLLSADAAQIKPGTPVQLTQWGGPGVLTGQVRLIEPAAFTKVSALGVEEQRVNVVINITSPDRDWHALGDGFKVEVRLLVQVVENAQLVPVSAVFPMGTRSGIFVLKNGRAHLQDITVNARNGTQAWVKTDLPNGSPVIVYPDTQLRDKDRVKPR